MFEGASAAGAGSQRTGGKDKLYRWQGQAPGLQSFRFTEDSPRDRHLPYTVSPQYTHCVRFVDMLVTLLSSVLVLPPGTQKRNPTQIRCVLTLPIITNIQNLNSSAIIHMYVFCCRFKSLQKPLDQRRAQLEASVLLFEFYHDVDLELSWISEHVPGSGSTAYDKSLAGAISLMQKHKVQSELLPSISLCKELSILNMICCICLIPVLCVFM